MGSFNGTCGVSGLPIVWRDPVRWFFIYRMPERYQSSLIDRQSRWKALTLPFKGTYDDYGRIEDVEEDALTPLQVAWLSNKARAPEKDADWLKNEGYPNTLPGLLLATERDEFVLEHVYGDVRTAPFLVHEDVYQEVLRIGLKHGPPTMFDAPDETELRRRMDLLVSFHREHAQRMKAAGSLEAGLLADWQRKDEIDRFFFDVENSLAVSLKLTYTEFPADTWSALEEAFVNLRGFIWGMQRLRCDWRPSLWTDQNDEYEIHEQFHLKVAEISREKFRRYQEEYGDEELEASP